MDKKKIMLTKIFGFKLGRIVLWDKDSSKVEINKEKHS